jgi:Hydroxymethylglutaryl-coenzyme A reductase
VITKDGMTRAPVVRFECAKRADEARRWLMDETNYKIVAEAFNGTSRSALFPTVCLSVYQYTSSFNVIYIAVFSCDVKFGEFVTSYSDCLCYVLVDYDIFVRPTLDCLFYILL